MVGRDTVTDIFRDKGRFSGEPSFVFLGTMRVQQSATAVRTAIRKSDVMTQASGRDVVTPTQARRLRVTRVIFAPYPGCLL